MRTRSASKARTSGSVKVPVLAQANQAEYGLGLSAGAIAPAAACSIEHTIATSGSAPLPSQLECWNNCKASNMPSANASSHSNPSYGSFGLVRFSGYNSNTVMPEQCTDGSELDTAGDNYIKSLQPTNQATQTSSVEVMMLEMNLKKKVINSKPEALGVLNSRLLHGGAIGSIPFTSVLAAGQPGTRFRCTNDCIGGRGLRVVDAVSKNVTIARGLGTLVYSDDVPTSPDYKIWDTCKSLLYLHPPTIEFPANLANTSSGAVKNNCRIKHKTGTSYFSIITIRALQPGEEVTVPYGSKFTKELRASQLTKETILRTQRAINCNLKVVCPKCKSMITKRKLKFHIDRIHCLKLQGCPNVK